MMSPIQPLLSKTARNRRIRKQFRRLSTFQFFSGSASAGYRAEYIGIHAVIVPELKLGNVQWHVLGADLVECSNHAALENRSKLFNRIRVDRACHIACDGSPCMAAIAEWFVPRCATSENGHTVADFVLITVR
jgi:hypothetical protein